MKTESEEALQPEVHVSSVHVNEIKRTFLPQGWLLLCSREEGQSVLRLDEWFRIVEANLPLAVFESAPPKGLISSVGLECRDVQLECKLVEDSPVVTATGGSVKASDFKDAKSEDEVLAALVARASEKQKGAPVSDADKAALKVVAHNMFANRSNPPVNP
jgi:hypothetical protein